MIRLTIRATNEEVPAAILKLMEERLAAGALVEEKSDHMRHHISDAFGNVMVA